MCPSFKTCHWSPPLIYSPPPPSPPSLSFCTGQAVCSKSNLLLKKIFFGQCLSSLALQSIFIRNKPLALTLFPSIKNLADSWDGCRTSAPRRSPSATWADRCQAGCRQAAGHTRAQLLDCRITSGMAGWDYSLFTQQIALSLWAYLLSAGNKALTCIRAVCECSKSPKKAHGISFDLNPLKPFFLSALRRLTRSDTQV